ncbi:hypothetical protein C2U68_11475 [Methylomonas koyamae]|nr:hypothetical protein C2U68_11475 [Methylomonas koyamae]
MPQPTTALIGRTKELADLTKRFTDGKTRLAIIVAAGGIGKSALTDEWLQHIAEHHYYGKTRVFGWSFYSQGSHNTFTNSQPFFSAVLPFLGINEIPKDDIEKARLLARECQKQPCLLILDGLEPLQYAENLPSMNGELQDSALKEFILQFRRAAGQSFVLLSSRQPLVELKKWQDEHFLSLPLATLPHCDGAKLLAKLGVQGNETERQAISQELNGHALSLVLMGHLLLEHHAGDPRYAKELPPLTSAHGYSDAEKDSRHALRVLDYYDSLQDAASRCFLQLLGLCDRPMNADEKRELLAKADHAAPLRALTDAGWKRLEQRLENNGVLLGKKGCFGHMEWDTHPIIRAYFIEKFKSDTPESFKQAHFVLFDFYQKLPEKEFPDTLEEMLPLYRAVVHGCLAGEYGNVVQKIFLERIWRGGEYYSSKKLGAYSQDLIGLSAFFSPDWLQPYDNDMPKNVQAGLFSIASFCFMCLGRFEESAKLRQLDINLHNELEDWGMAANSSENYTDLLLSLGKLSDAKNSVRLAIDFSNRANDTARKLGSFGRLATVLHRSGNLHQAQHYFEKTERLWREEFDDYPWTTSLGGKDYCSYLLDTASDPVALKKILERGIFGLKIAKQNSDSNDIAIFHLILAKTYQALQKSQKSSAEFDLAIETIQKTKLIIFMPEFYCSRADFYLTQNQLKNAATDLNSAWEVIERCGMKLYQVDYLLIHGRYSLAIQDVDTALNHYEEAINITQETGYHLRDAELDLFAAQLRRQCGEAYRSTNPNLYSQTPDYYLQKARHRIKKIGQWGLLRVIERDFPGI